MTTAQFNQMMAELQGQTIYIHNLLAVAFAIFLLLGATLLVAVFRTVIQAVK